jgi:hypothetical protein
MFGKKKNKKPITNASRNIMTQADVDNAWETLKDAMPIKDSDTDSAKALADFLKDMVMPGYTQSFELEELWSCMLGYFIGHGMNFEEAMFIIMDTQHLGDK